MQEQKLEMSTESNIVNSEKVFLKDISSLCAYERGCISSGLQPRILEEG